MIKNRGQSIIGRRVKRTSGFATYIWKRVMSSREPNEIYTVVKETNTYIGLKDRTGNIITVIQGGTVAMFDKCHFDFIEPKIDANTKTI